MIVGRAFGFFLFCLGLAVIYGGLSLEVPFSYDPLGPKTFPVALGIMLTVLSLVVIVKPEKAYFPSRRTQKHTVFLVLFMLAYALSFKVLGFILATGVLVFLISRIFAGSNKQALGAAVGLSLGVYAFFDILLQVKLPTGIIFSALLGSGA